LLSVGYSACHWCHVMAHESFEDHATADLMNRLFISIKVDREERPDVDGVYQHAVALLGGQNGWPLTVFLTPEGEPFWGGTYFPPEPGFGRPSFRAVLERISETYVHDREAFHRNAGLLTEAVAKSLSRAGAAAGAGNGKLAGQGGAGDVAGLPSISTDLLRQTAKVLLGHLDPVNGGLGGAPKFPQATILGLFWRAYAESGEIAYRDAVTFALRRMSEGGIYDHLGGGFSRYTVDERWLVPHFEKMLYDNALLLELLVLAWTDGGEALFRTRAIETVGWLAREMRLEGGAFASALDADSEGREGAFYTWSQAEIEAVLGSDQGLFRTRYDISEDGNWEGVNILNRLAATGALSAAEEERLGVCREKLLKARGKRVRPGLDDKVLADWNGMMIAALVRASLVFDESAFLTMARDAFSFVRAELVSGRGGLAHSWAADKAGAEGFLDDYAQMARAAIFLFEATGEEAYLATAKSWADELLEHFGGAGGGFYMASDKADALIVRAWAAADGPTPSGNAVAAEVFSRLYALTGKPGYRQEAARTLGAFAGEVRENPPAFAGLLGALHHLEAAPQIIVLGGRSEAAVREMLEVVWRAGLADYSLLVTPDGDELPGDHPAFGKTGAPGTAYLCRGSVCSLPLASPDELAKALSEKPAKGFQSA
ncbi:MAG: thioredoxin domain-containing protein, partial [Sphingomonadales bacterium]